MPTLSLHSSPYLSFFANFIDDRSNINTAKLKELDPMKTEQPETATAVFLQTVSAAITQLKRKLQKDYQQTYPELREIFHLVLDEEEAKAWELSLFPHLLLPDLVEAHVATLGLQPPMPRHSDMVVPHRFFEIPNYQSAPALCG